MSTNTQIAIAVAVVLVLAVAGYLYWERSTPAPVDATQPTTQQTTQ